MQVPSTLDPAVAAAPAPVARPTTATSTSRSRITTPSTSATTGVVEAEVTRDRERPVLSRALATLILWLP